MNRTLQQFMKTKLAEFGLNQTQLAEMSGVPRTTINRIKQGTTQLPDADVRRRLAAALGVTHVQLLVEAGELTEEEAGPQPPPPFPPDDPRAEIVTMLYGLTPEDVADLYANVRTLVGVFRRHRQSDTSPIH